MKLTAIAIVEFDSLEPPVIISMEVFENIVLGAVKSALELNLKCKVTVTKMGSIQ